MFNIGINFYVIWATILINLLLLLFENILHYTGSISNYLEISNSFLSETTQLTITFDELFSLKPQKQETLV